MIESDGIRARLLDDPAITALIGAGAKARAWPLVLPQDPEFPALTFQTVSSPGELTHAGPDGLVWCRMQIDCWATTYASAKALAKAVRQWLNGWSGTVGTEQIQLAQLLNARDLYEPEARLYHVSQDWGVWHDED